jgi:hypothetical protein
MITLSHVMKANAASCIGFGTTFLLATEGVINFLSVDKQAPSMVFTVLGIGLLLNGLHLVWVSFKVMPSKPLVLYFSFGDYIWVLATLYLLLAGIWITTAQGVATALLVSLMVATFGVLQMIKRKAMGHC